ncbi:hypothetical protein DBR39_03650 [Chryseobacterium sp. KBW03]|uniref:DUF6705 family protein n=1 Tax=Chryseobacterium sp. KBW03 TaxID=2153362 RepID=UPI000F5A4371|nr:hypothetical protein [Chryseobacterium sp. KBW03]RQO41719.1 hypothetical protein DBR39_03650 [Chryseobacterium sp. KBW03]
MKYLFFLLLFFAVLCRGQQHPLSLNTLMENIPQGGYVKDLDNELSPYVGIYKANFQGNEITLYITKEENREEKDIGKTYYKDALIIKFKIKNSSGSILQNTSTINFPTDELSNNFIYSIGTKPNINSVVFIYSGTNCGVGWGKILLKKLSATQISWAYKANSTVTTEQNCPGSPDLTVYLPITESLIFTKQ